MSQLGMRPGELDGKPYARFWNPQMQPLSHAAIAAVTSGPKPAPLLPALGALGDLEDAWGYSADGAAVIAIRTPMPDVTPAMIRWWFAWHSDEPQRYKLWHPRAHVHARWKDPGQGYVGRTSIVDEYIGDRLSRFAIRFVAPSSIGADEDAVCARVGVAGVEGGWLMHHVRPGEMRSRFWIGGAHAPALVRWIRPPRRQAEALLVHCAEEMAHLASFLPALFAELT